MILEVADRVAPMVNTHPEHLLEISMLSAADCINDLGSDLDATENVIVKADFQLSERGNMSEKHKVDYLMLFGVIFISIVASSDRETNTFTKSLNSEPLT